MDRFGQKNLESPNIATLESAGSRRKRRSPLPLVIIFLVLLIGVLIWLMYWSTLRDKKMPPESEQLQKLSAQNEKKDSLDMTNIKLGKKTILVNECYGITIPFVIRKVSRTQPCSMLVSLDSEHGTIAITYREHEGSTESPDVGFRRANPDKYQESQLSGREGQSFVVFRNMEAKGYEKSAFLQKNGFTISVNFAMDFASQYDRDFQDVLSSLYCVNECRL